ncbi:MAG: PEGA domain-containing protein [Polyangiales bacterium]
MRPPPATLAALALLLPALALAQPAPAEHPTSTSSVDPLATAREAFQQGVAFTQQQRWGEAVEAFRRSRAAADRPRTVFNLALALQHLGRMREARQALHECLAMPATQSDASLVRDAETLLAAVRGAVATLELQVAPTESTVRADGELRTGSGRARLVDLDPGRHAVNVSAEGMNAQDFSLTLSPGERVVRRVDLASRPATVVIVPSVTDATVSVDGDVVGRGRVEWTGPAGAHAVRVEAAGHVTSRRRVSANPGQRVELVVEVSRERTVWQSPALWATVGSAVVAGAVLAVALIRVPEDPDSGTTGQLFEGIRVGP